MKDQVAPTVQNKNGIARVNPPDAGIHVGHIKHHGNHALNNVIRGHTLTDDNQHLVGILRKLGIGYIGLPHK